MNLTEKEKVLISAKYGICKKSTGNIFSFSSLPPSILCNYVPQPFLKQQFYLQLPRDRMLNRYRNASPLISLSDGHSIIFYENAIVEKERQSSFVPQVDQEVLITCLRALTGKLPA
ncbi:hypothetical protein CEXT_46511 [Caerostris extrusa]|uniref:Uncharacterized protein n=1 Tax=Caerostris extrusa TaxID=172846 RepID=A0AAV4MPP6_CAEEX|nr:hypothetical protein CEXT_46511 [Caerostris extrusa]